MKFIGLMSGTSLDGIDAAIIETDGESIFAFGETFYYPYEESFRMRLSALINGEKADWLLIEQELTELHAKAVHKLLDKASLKPSDITAMGFHGQTIVHRPSDAITWQIGNGGLLAELSGIDVVCDFRRRDMANGGQGAPLVPIFHKALLQNNPEPAAILNLGGVSNLTYVNQDIVIAYDAGLANAIINDACKECFNQAFDDRGILASQGIANDAKIQEWLQNPYFKQNPPKSLDRNFFHQELSKYRENESNKHDVIATITKFAAQSITESLLLLPYLPITIYAAGGGVKNLALMKYIESLLPKEVKLTSIKEKGLDPDFIEAQAFAYLAARNLKGLPTSFPTTTGNRRALYGAAFYRL